MASVEEDDNWNALSLEERLQHKVIYDALNVV